MREPWKLNKLKPYKIESYIFLLELFIANAFLKPSNFFNLSSLLLNRIQL